jgi:hypothetical protein
MKLRLAIVVCFSFLLSACSLTLQKSGIEIISYPSAKVYIDDKEAGVTPYKNNSIKPGEVKVKLVANGQEWVKTVHLENGANTVINREFGDNGETGGYVLYFETTGNTKKAGFMISTQPDRSTVLIDDEIKGFSPLRLEDVGEGDRKLTISFPGRRSINSFVRFVNNYQLVIEADLSSEKVVVVPTSIPSMAAEKLEKMVTIKETETGWLRVRSVSSSSGAEIAKVKPKEKYKILEESDEWIMIDLGGGKSGRILAKYADKSL